MVLIDCLKGLIEVCAIKSGELWAHYPLLIDLYGGKVEKKHRPFRFEVAWTFHANFSLFMNENWKESEDMLLNLENITQALRI